MKEKLTKDDRVDKAYQKVSKKAEELIRRKDLLENRVYYGGYLRNTSDESLRISSLNQRLWYGTTDETPSKFEQMISQPWLFEPKVSFGELVRNEDPLCMNISRYLRETKQNYFFSDLCSSDMKPQLDNLVMNIVRRKMTEEEYSGKLNGKRPLLFANVEQRKKSTSEGYYTTAQAIFLNPTAVSSDSSFSSEEVVLFDGCEKSMVLTGKWITCSEYSRPEYLHIDKTWVIDEDKRTKYLNEPDLKKTVYDKKGNLLHNP